MGKKRKKKKYSGTRSMELVCVDCKCLWRFCGCSVDTDSHAYILVNREELEYYFETGLVPDHKSLLVWYSETNKEPDPIPLVHPPEYSFNL